MFTKIILTLVTLTVLFATGCSSTQLNTTISKALEIAYVNGGATLVEEKIDSLVSSGKITSEQAVLLKHAAKQSYENLQKKLNELELSEQ